MKKALVLSLVLAVGLGFAATADLTGSWESTLKLDPDAAMFAGFITSFASILTVDYALSGWAFGSVSTFDLAGYAAQKFTVSGSLGAFSIAAGMYFDPSMITEKVYADTFPLSLVWCDDALGCPQPWTVGTVAPQFEKLDATLGVSIAGVTFEAYVLQWYDAYDVVNRNYLQKTYKIWFIEYTEQTDSTTFATKTEGMGWRFKAAGSFGDVTVTSLTYFNLIEADSSSLVGCPVIGKKGTFKIANPNCIPAFYEEYLMLEGFGFGCASVDIALSILCTGFADIEFFVSGISLGGWATADFSIVFTVDSKAFDLCLSLNPVAFDCIVLEIGFGNTGYVDAVIDNITVHGVSLTQTWLGLTFTSVTELDIYSALMSTATAWTYVNGTSAGFLVPYVGMKTAAVAFDCENPTDPCLDAVYFTVDDGWMEQVCVVGERYRLWEKFTIDVDADACCGGLFDLTVATSFGEHEILDYYGYAVYTAATAYRAGEVPAALVTLYGTLPVPYDTTYGVPSAALHEDPVYTAIANDDYEDAEGVKIISGYAAGGQTTLFDWAKTEVDLGVGVGANITLTLGLDVSPFGWGSLDFGFKWAF